MDNRDNNPDGGRSAGGGRANESPSGDPSQKENEWLQDQIGEDHNLSGSDTYRTLPDQPAEDDDDQGAKDTSDRQSNR
jgi:hypothetical protein